MAMWRPGLYCFTWQHWAGLSRLLGRNLSTPVLESLNPTCSLSPWRHHLETNLWMRGPESHTHCRTTFCTAWASHQKGASSPVLGWRGRRAGGKAFHWVRWKTESYQQGTHAFIWFLSLNCGGEKRNLSGVLAFISISFLF